MTELGYVVTATTFLDNGLVRVAVTLLDGRKLQGVISPVEYWRWRETRVVPIWAAQRRRPELHY